MKCPKCNQDNIIGAVYCDSCGTNLKEAQKKLSFSYSSYEMVRPVPAAPPAPVFSSAPAAPAPDPVYSAPAAPAYAPAAPAPAPVYAPAAPAPAPAYSAPAAPAYAPAASAPAPAYSAPAAPAVPQHAYAYFSSDKGEKFYISAEKVMLGRGPAEPGQGSKIDFVDQPSGATVSKKHAVIIKDSIGIFIEDIGSGNGTFVNEEKLPRGLQKQLFGGENVRLGGVRLVFRLM